jgi:signal transduction histidine kinase
MKIRAQFYLLITGIIAVPFLAILVQNLFFDLIKREEAASVSLPVYEDVAELLDGDGGGSISLNDWEALSRYISRTRGDTDYAVFRRDQLIIFSTIPELAAGEYARLEKVFDLLVTSGRKYTFIFDAPPWLDGRGLILRRIDHEASSLKRGWQPFNPVFFVIIIGMLIVLFAVVMSLFIAGSITRSVQALENATRRIAAGELDLKVDIKGSNEITSLTASLNHMRDELKEEERRRARFIMGVTHDLKTPLALIRGYAEAIEDGITARITAGGAPTEIIKSKVDQLEGMINDLIDYVRMDSGEWRSQLNDVDIHRFLTAFAERFAPDAELFRHKMTIDIRLPEGLLMPLDEKLVIRALENLLNNAIRFTPDGTTIALTAEQTQDALLITVSDNGPGIAPQDLPHIFETFYRGSSSRREQGMGLGLAVVKWVVDFHGWTITATANTNAVGDVSTGTSAGTGTRFTIKAPTP